MEEILHHLGCMKSCNGINYQPQLDSRISSSNSMFKLLALMDEQISGATRNPEQPLIDDSIF